METALQSPIQTPKAIGYCRVSSHLQKDGYSLEAQEEAIRKYCTEQGLELLDVYTEIESGRRNNREVVSKVLNLCKLQSAKLIIYRLDRLTRDLHFLTQLQKSKLEFTALDNPSADNLVIQILTSIAENESVNISKRTKFALDLAKKKGVTLGNYKNLVAIYHRLNRDYPEQFEAYAKLRRQQFKKLLKHKKFNEFSKVVEPVYERVETPFGWDEWIKKPNQWGYKQTFEEEYEYWEWVKMKLRKVIPTDPWIKKRSTIDFTITEYNHVLIDRFNLRHQVGEFAWALGLVPFITKATRETIHQAWKDCIKFNTVLATQKRSEKAREEALDYLPHIQDARANGVTGIRPLGRYLDEKKIPTKTGKKWSDSPASISKLLKLLEGQKGI